MSQGEEQCFKSPHHWLAESQRSPAKCRSQTFLIVPAISSSSVPRFGIQCLTARAAESSGAVWTRTSPHCHSLARASCMHAQLDAGWVFTRASQGVCSHHKGRCCHSWGLAVPGRGREGDCMVDLPWEGDVCVHGDIQQSSHCIKGLSSSVPLLLPPVLSVGDRGISLCSTLWWSFTSSLQTETFH